MTRCRQHGVTCNLREEVERPRNCPRPGRGGGACTVERNNSSVTIFTAGLRFIDSVTGKRQQTMAQPLEPATPFLHIGETDCVAGHIGLELRCAKRKFISLRSPANSDSVEPGPEGRRSRENNMLCWTRAAALPAPLRARNRHRNDRPDRHERSGRAKQGRRLLIFRCKSRDRRLRCRHR
jgi:hypothetical protein